MKELISIQMELKAPKNQYNKFGNFNYRSKEDILEALKPLLKKHNALLNICDEVVSHGNRVYIQATATISVGDKSVSAKGFAREAESKKGMDDSQITGTASSYAGKYALGNLFLIDDTKDADTHPPASKQESLSEEIMKIDTVGELAAHYEQNKKEVTEQRLTHLYTERKKEIS